MRAWLLRHLPWWAAMAVWWPALAVIGACVVVLIVGGLIGGVIAVVELDGVRAVRALLAVWAGIPLAAFGLNEVRRWRELTPTALRAR
jgi:hypothetical protein